jgi:hypothetical protein
MPERRKNIKHREVVRVTTTFSQRAYAIAYGSDPAI